MRSTPANSRHKKLGIAFFCLLILLFGIGIQQTVTSAKSILFFIGVGLGIALLHANYGFSGSWKQFILNRNSQGVRSNILLLMLASMIFFPIVGNAFDMLNVSAALGPVSVSVFIGALMFGIGMQLGGGCGSGTLFTVGQGQTDMLITLLFFVVGSTLATAHLDWWLMLPSAGTISLIDNGGWLSALTMQLLILLALYYLVSKVDKQANLQIKPLWTTEGTGTFVQRLIAGPWPLWWGVLAIVLLSLLTLLIAGHTWSITFAFGLWGAKIWSALGGDVATWPYWGSGYPAQALEQSVLADTTSVMNFGIVLGAALAAVVAGKQMSARISVQRVVSALIGGLLLGYGARLGFGCNIGAMFSGISTGSMHGWLWLAAAFMGNIIGIQLRQKMHSSNTYIDEIEVNRKLVIGSALSAAAFLVAIDHTKSPLPEVKPSGNIFASLTSGGENPCSLEVAPCSLNDDESPCSL